MTGWLYLALRYRPLDPIPSLRPTPVFVQEERKEREVADREFERRENERRANWATPLAAGAAGIAAASVVSAMSDSSSRDNKKKDKKDKKEKKRSDSIPVDSRYEVYRTEDQQSE